MVIGLLKTGLISLTQWAPIVHSRAESAQSRVPAFKVKFVNCAKT
jgi:hypothetical protein